MSKSFLSSFFLCISLCACWADDTFNTFGIGILTAPTCIDLQIPLYEAENGEEPGAFLKQKIDHGSNWFVIVTNDGIEMKNTFKDAIAIGYEEVAITVFEETPYGFKIAINETNGEGYWISKTDAKRYHLSHWNWMDFLTKNHQTLFPEAMGIPMNLREHPEATSNKLATLDKDIFQITLTGETKGLWAKVSISQFTAPYCEDAEFVRNFTGWVKLLDNKGFPNLWFYAKGC